MAEVERGQAFSLRLVAGLVAAGIAAFAAFLVLAAYAGDFRSGRDGRPHALSVAATGFKGLVGLLEGVGEEARLVRSSPDLGTEDLLVVALEGRLDGAALADLVDARRDKPTLLILPKWETMPDPINDGWVAKIGLADPEFLTGLLSDLGDVEVTQPAERSGESAIGRDYLSGIALPAPALRQSISGEDVTPLLTAGADVLLAEIGGGALYLLADPDLFNNQGLADPRTARAAVEIVRRLNSTGAQSVAFDLTLNGFARQPNALKLLFEPPFLALTLALFAAALLAGLHGAFRFGPEQGEGRVIAFGKTALVENSAGLLRMARREHRAGAAYADLVGDMAARAAGAPVSLHGPERDAYLDRLSQAGDRPYSELAARIAAARDRHELVAAARALFHWKKDISQ